MSVDPPSEQDGGGRSLADWFDANAARIEEPSPPEAPAPPDEEIAAGDDEEDGRGKKRRLTFWQELPVLIVIALVLAVVVKTFLFQAFYIPSGSMRETLEVNDRVMVNKLSYRFGEVKRGQIVVFEQDHGDEPDENLFQALVRNLAESIGVATPEADLIKRVIGLPGDTIEIRDNQVFVNELAISEPYLQPNTRMGDYGPTTVPEGHYFVMGDNRGSSQDSRVIGPVEEDRLIGRAFVIIWPPSHWSGL